jgi:hypothetical protein
LVFPPLPAQTNPPTASIITGGNVGGALTVSADVVTVNGTVSGAKNITGGIVKVNGTTISGPTIPPATNVNLELSTVTADAAGAGYALYAGGHTGAAYAGGAVLITGGTVTAKNTDTANHEYYSTLNHTAGIYYLITHKNSHYLAHEFYSDFIRKKNVLWNTKIARATRASPWVCPKQNRNSNEVCASRRRHRRGVQPRWGCGLLAGGDRVGSQARQPCPLLYERPWRSRCRWLRRWRWWRCRWWWRRRRWRRWRWALNANGVPQQSPGLARGMSAYPGLPSSPATNPNGVAQQRAGLVYANKPIIP